MSAKAPACVKIRYRDAAEARVAIAAIGARGQRMNYYRCTQCRGLHLATHPEDKPPSPPKPPPPSPARWKAPQYDGPGRKQIRKMPVPELEALAESLQQHIAAADLAVTRSSYAAALKRVMRALDDRLAGRLR
jgi:hypothetical protein